MLHNGIFGCQGNICHVIFINAFFARYIYTIGLINVCANFEINRYTVMNLANMQNRVLFDVT